MSSEAASTRHFRGRIIRRMTIAFGVLTGLPVAILVFVYRLYQSQIFPDLTIPYLLAGILLALYIGLLWAIVHFFLKPVIELARTYQLFAEGNWELRLPVNRNDELGLLAFSFNRFADEMAILYRQLEALRSRRQRGITESSPTGENEVERAFSPALASPPPSSRWTAIPDQATASLSNLISAIVQAESRDQVLTLAHLALTATPYATVLLLPEQPGVGKLDFFAFGEAIKYWRVFSTEDEATQWLARYQAIDSAEERSNSRLPAYLPTEALHATFASRLQGEASAQSGYLPGATAPLFSADPTFANLPPETTPLVALPLQLQCRAAAFIPVMRRDERGQPYLAAAMVLGARDEESASAFSPENEALQPFIALIELITSALIRVHTRSQTQHHLEELQVIARVSQSVAVEANLDTLFEIITQQVVSALGEFSSIALAFYDSRTDTVRIPYLIENGVLINVPPFPLGEGLTSTVIRSAKPLLLVENLEERARELGARLVGEMPKSWLGVPLIFGGEVIGALIVQDMNQEGRFGQSEQELLVALSAHLAAVVRNTILLEDARRLAQNEKQMSEIASRIRRSVDLETVLKTTAEEVGVALKARRARIEIKVDQS